MPLKRQSGILLKATLAKQFGMILSQLHLLWSLWGVLTLFVKANSALRSKNRQSALLNDQTKREALGQVHYYLRTGD